MLVAVSGFFGCSATMPAVQMKFIDANDGSPISDAHVLFHAQAYRSNGLSYTDPTILFLAEGVTDAMGGINFPAEHFWPYPYLFMGYAAPTMVVFKPGYTLTVLPGGREDVEKWEYNNQVIKMQPAKSDKEFALSVWGSAQSAEEIYDHSERDVCMWKKIPGFLVATDRAVTNWNKGVTSISDQELRQQYRTRMGPIQNLISREAFYVKQGCGSPRLFFESYVAP